MTETTLYKTTRQTLVERIPVVAQRKTAAPDYVQPVEDQKLEMVLDENVNGVRRWREKSGRVLTICRTSPEAAEVLRRVAELVQV